MLISWPKRLLRDFQVSYDADELIAGSSPSSVLVVATALTATLLVLGLVPGVRETAQLTLMGPSIALVLLGAAATLGSWKEAGRGLRGALFALVDNIFYSAALTLAAVNSSPSIGVALSVVHGLAIVLFPARVYAPSSLFFAGMALPQLGAILVFHPTVAVTLILVASYVMMVTVSQSTGARHAALERQLKLEAALHAADRLADESMQAALTSTLLTLGHFLHELRNFQTAIAANLEFVETDSALSEDARSALLEAQEAQREQANLLRETIEDLRGRARPSQNRFHVGQLVLSEAKRCGPEVVVHGPIDFEVPGNPEHLRVVLLNLFRNAKQAGASHIDCGFRLEPSGSAIRITVLDDGPGISETLRPQLFDSFVTSGKPGGSGLGLYLVRRHVELLGGQVRVEAKESGGTQFVIILPGRVLTPSFGISE